MDASRPTSPGLLRTSWTSAPIETKSTQPQPADPDLRCLLAMGSALLSYGLPAHRIEEALLRLGRAFGRRIGVFGLPTAALITVYAERGTDTYTARAEPSTIDLSRLDALHSLVARVERGELDAHAAEETTQRILNAPRRYPRWLDIPAVASVAFGGSLMLGARLTDAAFAGLFGVGMAVLLGWSAPSFALSRVVPVLATVLVTFAACMLAQFGFVAHPLVVAFSTLFVLLPGLTLTLAMTELATGHLVSGATRSISAAVVFLQLGFGILLGLRLSGIDPDRLAPLSPASLDSASIGALLLALGFGVLSVIRARDAPITLAISALAFYASRTFGVWLGAEIGALIAASLVGVCSHAFARWRDRPSSTLALPGVVMLVPGSLGILAVSAAALHDPSRALQLGFQMMMVIVALSTGILISAAALPPRTAM